MICFMTFDMFLWKPVSATEYKNKKGYCDFLSHNSDFFFLRIVRYKLATASYKVIIAWYKLVIARRRKKNCEIKGRNYLFYFFHMFLSWNLVWVELIRTSSQTFRCKFQNVILELITEAWAIDMQANAVINAVIRERERERERERLSECEYLCLCVS